MKPADYTTWYARHAEAAARPDRRRRAPAPARRSSRPAGCVACHTFTAIPAAKGTIGPSLDNLTQAAATAQQSLLAYIKQSIIDPNAYITPGYQPNVMPQTFGTTLVGDARLNTLVQYLARNTK